MANIAKRNDRYTIRFTNFDGTRRQLYGFTNERLAQRIGEKIDDLVVARRMGTIPEELKSWLQKLEPSIHEKLAEWGLCDPPKVKWTLKNLTDSFLESRKNDPPTSMQKYLQVQTNLNDYFTEGRDLDTITPSEAKLFEIWLRTEPLNRGVPYATATCARRIGCIKLIFKYGVEIGMMPASPMAALRGGEAVNPSRWQYVSVEDCARVIQTEPNLKTRVTVALLRFCGLRGTSDMIKLTWSDIAWSHEKTPCRILVHGQKNVRHGKGTRWVQPLHPVVERVLRDLPRFVERPPADRRSLPRHGNDHEHRNRCEEGIYSRQRRGWRAVQPPPLLLLRHVRDGHRPRPLRTLHRPQHAGEHEALPNHARRENSARAGLHPDVPRHAHRGAGGR